MLTVLHDQTGAGGKVRAVLAGFPGARFIELRGNPIALPAEDRGRIVAADLADPQTMRLLVRLLTRTGGDVPLIAVVDAPAWQRTTQAGLLGAVRCYRASDAEKLLKDPIVVTALMRPSAVPTSPAAVEAVDSAVRVLATCMTADPIGSASPAMREAVEATLEAVARDGIESWLSVVKANHEGTYRHVLLVLGLAVAFGLSARLPPTLMRKLAAGALLHDVGKARLPPGLLDKSGPLSPPERARMREHPGLGLDMLKRVGERDPDVLDCVLSHHELMDGSGYPNRLAGTTIRPLTRMLTIADIYAALIEKRAYKPAMGRKDAFRELKAMSGKLDQGLVATFRAVAVVSEPPVTALRHDADR